MYIKKELLIDAFKIEYEHYFKKNNFFRIIIKIIKDNFFYFILSNNHKELDISKYHKILMEPLDTQS